MRKLNPLYVVALLLVGVVFTQYELYRAKSSLEENYKIYKENKEIAVKLKTLKKEYATNHILALMKMLDSKRFADAHFHLQKKSHSLKVTSKSISLKDLNYLFSKLLNGNFPVSGFEIIRLSQDKAQLKLELRW